MTLLIHSKYLMGKAHLTLSPTSSLYFRGCSKPNTCIPATRRSELCTLCGGGRHDSVYTRFTSVQGRSIAVVKIDAKTIPIQSFKMSPMWREEQVKIN